MTGPWPVLSGVVATSSVTVPSDITVDSNIMGNYRSGMCLGRVRNKAPNYAIDFFHNYLLGKLAEMSVGDFHSKTGQLWDKLFDCIDKRPVKLNPSIRFISEKMAS